MKDPQDYLREALPAIEAEYALLDGLRPESMTTEHADRLDYLIHTDWNDVIPSKALELQAADLAKEQEAELIEFVKWVEGLSRTQRCTVHPPAGSGGSVGIYPLSYHDLLTQFRSKGESRD